MSNYAVIMRITQDKVIPLLRKAKGIKKEMPVLLTITLAVHLYKMKYEWHNDSIETAVMRGECESASLVPYSMVSEHE